eukprot:2307827-Amphidinium_carterae.2
MKPRRVLDGKTHDPFKMQQRMQCVQQTFRSATHTQVLRRCGCVGVDECSSVFDWCYCALTRATSKCVQGL